MLFVKKITTLICILLTLCLFVAGRDENPVMDIIPDMLSAVRATVDDREKVELELIHDDTMRPVGSTLMQSDEYRQIYSALEKNEMIILPVESYDLAVDLLKELRYSAKYHFNKIYKYSYTDGTDLSDDCFSTVGDEDDIATVFYKKSDSGEESDYMLRVDPIHDSVDYSPEKIQANYDKAFGLLKGAGIDNSTTKEDAVRIITDIVCGYLDYDSDSDKLSKEKGYECRTWFDGLDNGKIICEGYAELTAVLCRMCGIDCKYVVGCAMRNGQKMLHAWNMITIDGQTFYVDNTAVDNGLNFARRMSELPSAIYAETIAAYDTLDIARQHYMGAEDMADHPADPKHKHNYEETVLKKTARTGSYEIMYACSCGDTFTYEPPADQNWKTIMAILNRRSDIR